MTHPFDRDGYEYHYRRGRRDRQRAILAALGLIGFLVIVVRAAIFAISLAGR